MPPQLSLSFLGPPQIQLNHEPVTADRRKAVALLAYLAVEGGRQTRDTLSALLWPEYDQTKAFTNLRHILWEIQQALGEGWMTADREAIELVSNTDISLDVREFEASLSQGQAEVDTPKRIVLLTDAVKLYRNHFLTGFSLKDSPGFNEWAFNKSEELRHQFAGALAMLAEIHSALGQADQAIPYARRLITLDPLKEASHRQLMQIYLQAGQHSAALKQYQACEQILRQELGTDPQPETLDLYKKIRKRQIKPMAVEQQKEERSPRHNLPLQLSSFIGREKEVNDVTDLVKKRRLVTLAGTGGIGKTRLALQAGQKLLNEYPGGVWWIALDSLSNPALVTQTVASLFDIRESTDRPLLEKLTESLRAKHILFIMDNCEHLLEACARVITALLTQCPNLKVLATSREPLGIPGESIYSMPSLPLPEPGAHSLDELNEIESVQLFAERAALALTSFQLTLENMQAVADICRKVDGIPLAIELAAARVNLLQVEEILRQLQDSFALLTTDLRTVLPRQQTLRGSIEWSWSLLSEAEQAFLRQLSVFAGGWTLESARAVCTGEILELVSALVKKSLIVVNQATGRETRYYFHEMVRQFAHEKLVLSGEEDKIHTLHLDYFLELSTRAQLELRGSSRVDWMERLNEERNNLRAALHWAKKTNVEAGLFLSSRLQRYWESYDVIEGTQWLKSFLDQEGANEVPRAKAYALYTYGYILVWLQDFAQARSLAEQALALFRAVADREGQVDALLLFGNTFVFTHQLAIASKFGEQALELSRALGDPWGEANSLYHLGWMTRDYNRMFPYWAKAASLYRKLGDQVSLAVTLGWLGQFRVLNGDFELAEKYIDEALELWQFNQRANIWDNPKIVKSIILLVRGDHERAQALLQEVIISAEATGNIMSKLWAQVRLGYVALRSGNLAEAQHLFRETAYRFSNDGFFIGAIFALEGMAELFVVAGKPSPAARLIGWADSIRLKISDPRPNIEQADIDKLIAACLVKIGEAAFSDMYEDGQKMIVDEALAYAFASDGKQEYKM